MGIAENKQVIAEYFGSLGKGDYPAAIGRFADDITWWVLPASPMGGTYEGKDAVLGLFASGTGLYDASVPLAPTIEGMVAEGDKVAVELVITGRSAKGKDYRNHYHFLFTIRDGKIKAVKEYVDTLYSQKVLFE
jgi:ketosteroid isomerase-like protein